MVSGSRVDDNSAMEQTDASPADLQAAIHRALPLMDGLCILASAIQDLTGDLYPEERAEIEKAIDRRRHEFATGRVLARRAMNELDLQPMPVLRGKQREPIWPAECTGSITHAEQWAVACVARASTLRSVGIDLERADRVGGDLHGKLFNPGEQAAIAQGPANMAGLMFSAKEAIYKATFPLVGRFIGFREAEVRVDWDRQRFSLRYVGNHEPNRIMEAGEGHFLFCGPYVLSLVIIPNS